MRQPLQGENCPFMPCCLSLPSSLLPMSMWTCSSRVVVHPDNLNTTFRYPLLTTTEELELFSWDKNETYIHIYQTISCMCKFTFEVLGCPFLSSHSYSLLDLKIFVYCGVHSEHRISSTLWNYLELHMPLCTPGKDE